MWDCLILDFTLSFLYDDNFINCRRPNLVFIQVPCMLLILSYKISTFHTRSLWRKSSWQHFTLSEDWFRSDG